AEPKAARIADLWVLNTPARDTVHAYVRVEPADAAMPRLDSVDDASGRPLAADIRPLASDKAGVRKFAITAKRARPWTLDAPQLYRLTARLATKDGESVRRVTFGFRWFAPDGLGTNAL